VTAAAILGELRACGVEVYVTGDRVGLRPAQAVPPALIERARAVRDELLALLRTPGVPAYPLRVVVDVIAPRPTPFELSPGVRVVDTERCIRVDLAELEAVVAEYSRVWAGPSESPSLARTLGERIEELLERLQACGALVRVEAVQ